MPHNSLNNLLKKFPYFLDKSESSNFFKSQKVTNNQFQKIYQDLMNTYHSFHLNKRLLIWKEQSVPYEYVMHFVATFPLLKRVVIYCNDDIIYEADFVLTTEDFSYLSVEKFHSYTLVVDENDEENIQITHDIHTQEHTIAENITTFNYSHESVSDSIIPQENYLISVTTFDEYTYSKGFPENDTIIGNEYDHDISLDEIGEENNIPRKQYLTIDEDKYQETELIDRYNQTEPLFNNQSTEDDYHYMKRILEYLIRVQNQPLPVAEIWKLYGIDNVSLLNRGRLLLKMFDPMEHDPLISDDGEVYVSDWVPEAWEHKDGFCKKEEPILFFVNPSSTNPTKFTKIKFYFKFLNQFAETIDMDNYRISISVNGELIEDNHNSLFFEYSTENLDEINANFFKFTAYDNVDTIIGEKEVEINVRGCNDGDWYVNEEIGDDANDGSKESPFATLEKAVQSLNPNKNLIIIVGTVGLNELSTVNIPCTIIMGCNNGTLDSYLSDNRFLNIVKGNTVTLIDLKLKYENALSYSRIADYTNENESINKLESVIIHGGLPLLELTVNQEDYYHLYDNVQFSLSLKTVKNISYHGVEEILFKFSKLDMYINDEFYTTLNTGATGVVDFVLHCEDINPHDTTFKFVFNETIVFWATEIEKLVHFQKTTSRIDRKYGSLLDLSCESSTELNLYENGRYRHSAILTDDAVNCNYLPDYGEHLVYFSPDGITVVKEWVVNSRFYISDLNVHYLVTDVEILNNGETYVTWKPLTEFQKLDDLKEVMVDVILEDGKLYKEYFQITRTDLLNGNEIYPEDLINLQAIQDVTIGNDGKLEIDRIETIVLEEDSEEIPEYDENDEENNGGVEE